MYTYSILSLGEHKHIPAERWKKKWRNKTSIEWMEVNLESFWHAIAIASDVVSVSKSKGFSSFPLQVAECYTEEYFRRK